MTNHYELLYLVGSNYSEDELTPIRNTVRDLITKFEGAITFEDNFGKRKLAYPISKNNQGYYLIIEFDLEGEKLKDLDTNLTITNEVLRHIIVRREAGKAQVRLKIADDVTDEKPKSRPERTWGGKKEETMITRKVEAPVVVEDDSKLKLENLDEKLDEILDGDIM